MRFFTSAFTTVLAALASVAAAQADANGPNPLSYPLAGDVITPGSTVQVTWTPTSGSTIALILRSGEASDLAAGTTIVYQAPNSGSYSWTVPTTTDEGDDYAIEIISVQDKTVTNFSPQFTIGGSSSSSSSSASASSSSSRSSSSSTAAATTTGSTTSSSRATSTTMTASRTSSTTAAVTSVAPNAAGRQVVTVGFGVAAAALVGLVAAL